MSMKEVFIFIAGAGIGAVSTYFGVREHFRKIADEEIDDMRNYVQERIKSLEDSVNDNAENEKLEKINQKSEAIKSERGFKAYDELYKPTGEDILDKSVLSHKKEETGWIEPYSISPDDYAESQSYGGRSITYYIGNDVYIDEDGGVVEDPEHMFGSHCSQRISDAYYDAEDIYIRNENERVDFDFTVIESNYEG